MKMEASKPFLSPAPMLSHPLHYTIPSLRVFPAAGMHFYPHARPYLSTCQERVKNVFQYANVKDKKKIVVFHKGTRRMMLYLVKGEVLVRSCYTRSFWNFFNR